MKATGRREIGEAVFIALLITLGEVIIESGCDAINHFLRERRKRKKAEEKDDEGE